MDEGDDHVQGSTRQQGSEETEEGTGTDPAAGAGRFDADAGERGAGSAQEVARRIGMLAGVPFAPTRSAAEAPARGRPRWTWACREGRCANAPPRRG